MRHQTYHRLLLAAFFIAVALHAQTMPKISTTGVAPKAVTIHQEVDFKASPAQLYETLLDSRRFTAFSGRTAMIGSRVGGAFLIFDNHILGINVELVPNKRIVQAWRVVDWPEGVYSIAKFDLVPQGSGTRLVFDHTGFPEDQRDHLASGWEANYWSLLKKYLH
jgi:activator of HSP90 ATPase